MTTHSNGRTLPETSSDPSRVLPFERAPNFRDLGGYATGDGRHTRWRVAFRSSHLGGLSDADVQAFGALGIRDVFDLRRTGEVASFPNRLPDGIRTHLFDIDVGSSGQFYRQLRDGQGNAKATHDMMVALYASFVTDVADRFGRFLELLTGENDGAVLIHCMVGKDRTGLASALLLSALGVPRETVIEDYLLTRTEYPAERIVQTILDYAAHDEPIRSPREAIVPLCDVHEDYLDAAFSRIDRLYGGMDAYIEKVLGLDDAGRARLVQRFVA